MNVLFATFALTGILAMIAGVLFLTYPLLSWFFCWRNFKWFLFGLTCLIALTALFYIEQDWRGKHDWDQFKLRWEAKGEKFAFKDFIPPPVPADENFALTPVVASSYEAVLTKHGQLIRPPMTNVVDRLNIRIYGDSRLVNRPVNSLDDWQKNEITHLKIWQQYYRALAAKSNEFPIPSQPQSPAAAVLLALSKYDSTIAALHQASRLPCSRFPLDYDAEPPAGILLPHLGDLRNCARMLDLRAAAELQNGQSDQTLADLKLMLYLENSVRTEPFIISHLVRVAIVDLALQPIYDGLDEHKWSDAQLAELNLQLAKVNLLKDCKFSMRGECALAIANVDYIRRHRRRGLRLFPAGWFYQNNLAGARIIEQDALPAIEIRKQRVSLEAVRRENVAESTIAKHFSPFTFLARFVFPSLGQAVKRFAYMQASVDLARVAIALERYRLAHGAYPKSLDALAPQFIARLPHDIIGGQPLHYRQTAGGQFILYSVGWNGKDDGGTVAFAKGETPQVDISKGDWVWRYPAK